MKSVFKRWNEVTNFKVDDCDGDEKEEEEENDDDDYNDCHNDEYYSYVVYGRGHD